MTEKYKIYLSEDIRARLANDADLFEFTKSNGAVNLNGFLKELIVNFFDIYRHDNEALRSSVLSELSSVKSLSAKDAAALADKMIRNYINKSETSSGKSTVITLTVSGQSYDIIRIIENNFLKDNSLSGYIKDMFLSYLSMPRHKREEIIFRSTYETINKAIAENKVLTFTSTNSPSSKGIKVEPYLIATSKEEQFNYLLCHGYKCSIDHTFRISRLRNVFITSESFERKSKIEERLTRKGMRSPHSAANDIRAVVRLTDQGKKLFRVIVKNRPEVQKTEGDLYYFEWPERQLEDYFKRFGKEAVVMKPRSLKDKLIKYYNEALEAYTSSN